MIVIPTHSDLPSYQETVSIGGASYRLAFQWNTRTESWTFDISTTTGEPIVLGTRIVPDWDLLGRFVDRRLPVGRFIAHDRSGNGEKPGRHELGDRVLLIFATEDELVAAL